MLEPKAALKTHRVVSIKRGMTSETSTCQTAASKQKLKGGQILSVGCKAAA